MITKHDATVSDHYMIITRSNGHLVAAPQFPCHFYKHTTHISMQTMI